MAAGGVGWLFLAKTEVGGLVGVEGVRHTGGGKPEPGLLPRAWEGGLLVLRVGRGRAGPALLPRVGRKRLRQLGEELVGLECPSSRHLSPGLVTSDPMPHTALGRKARRDASSSVPTRSLHLKQTQ